MNKMNKKILLIISFLALLIIFFIMNKNREDHVSSNDKNRDSLKALFNFMYSQKNVPGFNEFDPEKVRSYDIEEADFIEDVILEKDRICVGEDVKVTVAASNPYGKSSHLVYKVNNQMGNPVILHFNKPGDREFYVTVRDEGKHIDFKKVKIKVMECNEKEFLVLKAQLHKTRSEEAEFEVIGQHVLSQPCIYEWDFGDGKHLKTNTGFITHNYSMRDQAGLQSTFLVSVKIRDSKNKEYAARSTISFPNIHYVAKMIGSPIVPINYNRFPQLNGSYYESDISIKNIFDEPLTFHEVQMEIKYCNSSLASDVRVLTLSDIMKTVKIRSQKVINDKITIPQSMLPQGTCGVIIQLIGSTSHNNVLGKIYLDIPPSNNKNVDPLHDKVVQDKLLIDKLNRAAGILGKNTPITPDDIKKLEKEGKL